LFWLATVSRAAGHLVLIPIKAIRSSAEQTTTIHINPTLRASVGSTKAPAGACGTAMPAASSRIASPSAVAWFGLAG
jgi:hypothetical protein